jgi:outer membrane protein, heavy metal efflux system
MIQEQFEAMRTGNWPILLAVLLMPAASCLSQPSAARTESSQQTEFAEPNGVLTLQNALALSLTRNPDLAAYSWEIRAQEGREIQAGLTPNPTLDVVVEEFGGTGERRELDAAQTTIQIGQIIETAQKRLKRKNLAAMDKALAGWDYEAKRLDVLTDTGKAYVDVLSLQERAALADELVSLSQRVSYAVSERVKAGRVAPLEETRADVASATAGIEAKRISHELETARKRLAAFWGSEAAMFARVDGNLFDVKAPPDAEKLASLLPQNPDLAKWATELKQRKAAVDLEKSKAVPDVTIGAGAQYFNDPGDTAFVVGLSIPLPLFDRNQGNIREAHARLNKGIRESQAARTRVRSTFAETYQLLSSSFEQASALRDKIVPGAQSAFDASAEGYKQGKLGYLDVLDAQRTLFEAKGQYIEVLASYHKTRADIERLVGRSLDSDRAGNPSDSTKAGGN